MEDKEESWREDSLGQWWFLWVLPCRWAGLLHKISRSGELHGGSLISTYHDAPSNVGCSVQSSSTHFFVPGDSLSNATHRRLACLMDSCACNAVNIMSNHNDTHLRHPWFHVDGNTDEEIFGSRNSDSD